MILFESYTKLLTFSTFIMFMTTPVQAQEVGEYVYMKDGILVGIRSEFIKDCIDEAGEGLAATYDVIV